MKRVVREVCSKKEIDEGLVLALLSYLGILVFIPFFFGNDNKFVKFHTKQGLNLFLLEILCIFVLVILEIFVWILLPLIGIIAFLLSVLFSVLVIIGMINVCKGQTKELPIIDIYIVIKGLLSKKNKNSRSK